jgi:PAS domain S-box-containing protein
MPERKAPAWTPFLAALLAVAAASLISALLLPLMGANILFVTYMIAVIVAASYGGLRPALFATALGYLVANVAFVPEADRYLVNWGTAAYFLGCVAIAILGETTRRARRRAATSAQRIVSLVESIPDGFVAVDERWRCTYMNRAAFELAHQSPDLGVGALLWDAFPLAADDASRAKIREAAAARQTVEFECFHEAWQAWFEIKVSPAEDRSLAIFFRDITSRKLNEMDLARMNAELRQSEKQKDDFLAMLAHELRNPLAAIQYANQLSKLTAPSDAAAGEVIDRQVANLAHLIEDLVDVSRITRDKIQLRKELVDGRRLFEHALETVRPVIEERTHELSVESSDEPMPIYADAVRVEQILVNLLTNAAKYTPEGGRISARAFPFDAQAVFRIRDSGIGIPPHMLPKVFDLFTQVDPSIDRTQGGLGIGLTVVRKLAEMHGGSASAASEGLGRGSEFVVRLPLCPEVPEAEAAAGAERSIRPLRILVVDDNVDMAGSLARLLEQAGHTTTTAHDGHAALAAARDFHPQVILLDIGLPGLDGYSVASALRREPELAGVRLVAISGYGAAEDRDRTKAAGFDHHLVKPVDFGQLTSVISNVGA